MRSWLAALALVAVFPLAGMGSGHLAHGVTPVMLSASGRRDGRMLTVSLPSRAYPENALIRVRLTVTNVSHRTLGVGHPDVNGCAMYPPVADVVGRDGKVLYPPVIPPGAMNSCDPFAVGLVYPLRPGASFSVEELAVLRGNRIRGSLLLPGGGYRRYALVTPPITVRLVPGTPPAVHFIGGHIPAATFTPPKGTSGRLYVVSNWNCRMEGVEAAEATSQTWFPARSAHLVAGESDCTRVTWWRAVAGWIGYPVATVRYGKRPGYPKDLAITDAVRRGEGVLAQA